MAPIVTPLLVLLLCTLVLATPMSLCTPGRSTFYTYTDSGSCGYGALGGTMLPMMNVAAPNQLFYDNATHCGECWEITGPLGTVTVMIADECPDDSGNPSCSGDMDHFDLGSGNTFSMIAPDSAGNVLMTKRQVSCPITGNVGVMFQTGSTNSWVGFLIFGHKVGIVQVKIQPNGADWVSLERATYNYWHYDSTTYGSAITSPFSMQVVSQTGETITMEIPAIVPDSQYMSTQQFQEPVIVGTSAPCTAPVAAPYIYVDGLYAGASSSTDWQDWSVGATINWECTTSPDLGTDCVCATIGGYGAIQIGRNLDINWTGTYQYLSFYVRGDSATKAVEVSFGHPNPVGISITTAWQYVKLDLEATMKAPTMVGYTNPLIFLNSLGTSTPQIYLDEIIFESD